ncbi:hypothetical protein BJF83_20515 [Nocardiopsis sp. CNR-923]|uniref:SAV_2336 N-terminal domain-related protein n=1 Tax=Nocardiopsis sp. CNR-923 TaxID=1904965 RepID=UPI00095BA4AD|nr:SAV_2336 N-terminal domain-related protein [Nocardiopsis sp. CNR-923]OLT26612.1 hypothetical protein BJF83_20515 [Nocardiopsis sp. CNR-923]
MTLEALCSVFRAGLGPDIAGGSPLQTLEMAEIIWLAAHLRAGADADHADGAAPDERGELPESSPRARSEDSTVEGGGLQPPSPSTATRPDPASPAASGPPDCPDVELHAPGQPDTHRGVPARRIPLPLPRVIREPREIQRALRPLKRSVSVPAFGELDEEATAERIAAHDPEDPHPWTAATLPVTERWLSLLLIVDTGPSMGVWRSMVREITPPLYSLGAFRDIRVLFLGRDPHLPFPHLGLSCAPDGPPRAPLPIVDSAARQVVLVLSDCSGQHWWKGEASALLHSLSDRGPTAIVQTLPEHQWHRTAAPVVYAQTRGTRPGESNGGLVPAAPPGMLPVPVLRCEPQWFASWASLITSPDRPVPMAMTYARPGQRGIADTDETVADEGGLPVRERVNRFRGSASRDAFLLAAHTALSTPTMSIMRRIQMELARVKLISTTSTEMLSEVVLSGLLRPKDSSGNEFTLVEGADRILISHLPRSAVVHTARALIQMSYESSDRTIAGREHLTTDATVAGGRHAVDAESKPFALVNPLTLRLLGWSAPPPADSVRPSVDPPPESTRQAAVEPRTPAEPSATISPRPWKAEPDRARHKPATAPQPRGRATRTQPVSELSRAHPPVPSVPLPLPSLPDTGHIVARPEVNRWLRNFRDGQVRAIIGPAGTGKTTLAAMLAAETARRPAYRSVLWVDASSRESVIEAFARADHEPRRRPASRFPHPGSGATDSRFWAERASDPWFMVLDGLTDPAIVDLVPPVGPGGRILITARHKNLLPDEVPAIRVGEFTQQQALDYLGRRLAASRPPHSRTEDLRELAGVLKRLPLSLSMAACLMVDLRMSANGYLAQWRGTHGADPDNPVKRTVLCSLRSVARQEGHSVDLFRYLLLTIQMLGSNVPAPVLSALRVTNGNGLEGRPRTVNVARLMRRLHELSLVRADGGLDVPDGRVRLHEELSVHRYGPWVYEASPLMFHAVEALEAAWKRYRSHPATASGIRTCAIALSLNSRFLFPTAAPEQREHSRAYYLRLARALGRILGPDHASTVEVRDIVRTIRGKREARKPY